MVKMGDINKEYGELYEDFRRTHIRNGGSMPQEDALTRLVAHAIKTKGYKIYNGGGYDIYDNPIQKYDVVVWFDWANDPFFMVALDVSEGDQCDLYRCNTESELEKIVK